MSDYMPVELQVEIIEMLPIKSLIQFRSVSKAWKSLIDSSEFIARYSVGHTQPRLLLISYDDPVESRYVSFVDDDTFPQQKSAPTVPLFVKQLNHSTIVGSCQGLFCLSGSYREGDDFCPTSETEMIVLWNPSIKKSVAVAVAKPKVLESRCDIVLGFGVCPDTFDPKIIHICMAYEIDRSTCIYSQVRVFTLSSGAWRTLSSNLPPKSIQFTMSESVVVDRFIYWSASDGIDIDGGFQTYNLIMSFDLTNDEFKEVCLPDSLALETASTLSISKLRESLAVIELNFSDEKQGYTIWIMQHGVPKSFVKLFTIKAPDALIIDVLGSRNTGEPILEVENDYEFYLGPVALVVYEPYSEHVNNTGIYGTGYSFLVKSYTESLVMLNQPDFITYILTDEDDD